MVRRHLEQRPQLSVRSSAKQTFSPPRSSGRCSTMHRTFSVREVATVSCSMATRSEE